MIHYLKEPVYLFYEVVVRSLLIYSLAITSYIHMNIFFILDLSLKCASDITILAQRKRQAEVNVFHSPVNGKLRFYATEPLENNLTD